VTVTLEDNSTVTPCDQLTGQCQCLNPGITGQRCDSCLPASTSKCLQVFKYNVVSGGCNGEQGTPLPENILRIIVLHIFGYGVDKIVYRCSKGSISSVVLTVRIYTCRKKAISLNHFVAIWTHFNIEIKQPSD